MSLECEREGASSGYFFFLYSTARAFALALSSVDRGAPLDYAPDGASLGVTDFLDDISALLLLVLQRDVADVGAVGFVEGVGVAGVGVAHDAE